MPDQLISFPETYEDMQRLYEQYIGSPDLDPDAFEYSPVSEGRSYSFYGKKAFEFSEEKGRLRVWGSTMILAGL
ncbi:hypothetical protein, partial [Ralstonia pseudosolanacearum]|uniref:hypothetical protein n=1 Tax=Ralstonia pseudosolanacearum TaxID=1310165 RepID=UPI003CEB9886